MHFCPWEEDGHCCRLSFLLGIELMWESCFFRHPCFLDDAPTFSRKTVIGICIEKPVPRYFNPAMIRENILFSTASEDRVLFSDGYQLSQSSPWTPPFYFWEICAWLLKIVYLESCLAVTNEVNSWWVIFNCLSLKVFFGRYSVINIITQHIFLLQS